MHIEIIGKVYNTFNTEARKLFLPVFLAIFYTIVDIRGKVFFRKEHTQSK
jgi:hypothetical protein